MDIGIYFEPAPARVTSETDAGVSKDPQREHSAGGRVIQSVTSRAALGIGRRGDFHDSGILGGRRRLLINRAKKQRQVAESIKEEAYEKPKDRSLSGVQRSMGANGRKRQAKQNVHAQHQPSIGDAAAGRHFASEQPAARLEDGDVCPRIGEQLVFHHPLDADALALDQVNFVAHCQQLEAPQRNDPPRAAPEWCAKTLAPRLAARREPPPWS